MAKTKLATPLTPAWKAQVNEMLDKQRDMVALNDMYQKLFRHYYFKRYKLPHFLHAGDSPEAAEWNAVYWFLSDAHRRSATRFSTTTKVERAVKENDLSNGLITA